MTYRIAIRSTIRAWQHGVIDTDEAVERMVQRGLSVRQAEASLGLRCAASLVWLD
jgi:hypothetical protein